MIPRRSFIGRSITAIGAVFAATKVQPETTHEAEPIALYIESGWHFGQAWNRAGSVAYEMKRPVAFTFNGNKAIRYPDGSRKCDAIIESMFFRQRTDA